MEVERADCRTPAQATGRRGPHRLQRFLARAAGGHERTPGWKPPYGMVVDHCGSGSSGRTQSTTR